MATPPNFLSRFSPYQFSAHNPLWPYNPHAPHNTPYNLSFPLFPNQLPIPYVLAHQQLYNASNSAYYNGSNGQVQVRGRSQSLGQPSGSVKGRFQKTFQKNRKTNDKATINLISDDEEPVQLQKVSQEKNTSSNTKTHDENPQVIPPITQLQKQEPKKEIQIHDSSRNPPKPKEQVKTLKTKEIIKQPLIKKKIKSKTQVVQKVPKKGPVFSKRIIEKQDIKKEIYRVSKRQRQLLQVSYLRDSNAMIMTGPQFQARLPKFMGFSQESDKWLTGLKHNLLTRQYKEQQY